MNYLPKCKLHYSHQLSVCSPHIQHGLFGKKVGAVDYNSYRKFLINKDIH